MKSTIDEIRHQIQDNNLVEGEYCIIIYQTSLQWGKQTKFVYKNFEDFEQKSQKDMETIPESHGVYVEWRQYD